jgi:hypothetical protein
MYLKMMIIIKVLLKAWGLTGFLLNALCHMPACHWFSRSFFQSLLKSQGLQGMRLSA